MDSGRLRLGSARRGERRAAGMHLFNQIACICMLLSWVRYFITTVSIGIAILEVGARAAPLKEIQSLVAVRKCEYESDSCFSKQHMLQCPA
jgi:hypothetical protein